MKRKIWLNFIIVLALALGSGAFTPAEQMAAHAALAVTGPDAVPEDLSATGEVSVRSGASQTPSDFSCTNVTEIPQSECEILLALYNNTDGSNWTNNNGWLVTNTPCSWQGILCLGGSVIYINFYNNNLNGSIPPEMGGLSNLQYLHLFSNPISGSIPPELGGLEYLISLYLNDNQLSGSIPPELGWLGNLQFLHLNGNQLSGSIPSGLGRPVNLKRLVLSSNQLSGSIPPDLGWNYSLQRLDLSANQLSGSIPPELSATLALGMMYNLQSLDLGSNQLSGNIPPELGTLASLQYLALDSNQLSGGIPAELSNLTNLRYLNLGSNQLGGGIPPELGTLTNLRSLYLNANQLNGSIPPELGDLSNLEWLFLAANQFNGNVPPQLGALPNLITLGLSSNQLSGSIPPALGGLSNLQYLYLSSNQLSGGIPSELGALTKLRYLALGNNSLSGSIPLGLGGLSDLQQLSLDHNQISGSIPVELGGLSNLQSLRLSSNQLSGSVPVELGGLTQLKQLLLDNNALSGDIPEEITALINLDPPNTGLGYNKLTASDPSVIAFLNIKDHDWAQTQTVPPTVLGVSMAYLDRIDLSWTPILYTGNGGFYEVSYSDKIAGTYTVHGTTSAKTDNGYAVDGLASGTSYYFRVRTFTPAHGYQQNDLWSEYTQPMSATTTVPVKVETATTIISDVPDPSPVGQPIYVTFKVTASSGTPTGTVTLTMVGEAASCLGSLAGGVGGCELTIHDPGTYTLTAAYSGDDDFLPSTAVEEHTVVEQHDVERDITTTILSDEPDPTKVGQPIYVTFEVTAGSGTPTGMVTVTVAEASCTGALSNGMGACEIETGATTLEVPGTYTLTATYSGDEHYLPSSAVEQHTRVAQFESKTIILSDEPDPSQAGEPFTVNFRVEPGSEPISGPVIYPSGKVHVQVGGEAMDCIGTLTDGTGSCEITLYVPGTYTLTAEYSGDGNFLPSNAVDEHKVVEKSVAPSTRLFLPVVIR